MPRRARSRKRRLTLVEILILAAIGGIFLSIVVPSVQKHGRRGPAAASRQVAALSDNLAPQRENKGSETSGALFVGFAAGIVVTLLYQRWRAARTRVDKGEMEEAKPRHDDLQGPA